MCVLVLVLVFLLLLQFAPNLNRHASDLRTEFLSKGLAVLQECVASCTSEGARSQPSSREHAGALSPGDTIRRCFDVLKVLCCRAPSFLCLFFFLNCWPPPLPC